MSDENGIPGNDPDEPIEPLCKLLMRLQLSCIRSHYHELAQTAAEQQWSHLEYLQRLIEAEVAHRDDKSLERSVRLARFPLFKTLDQFQWSWPKKINRPQIQNLFHLGFIEQKANVLFLSGTPGLGKTHLSIALGRAACSSGYSVLFTTAINMIQTLSAAASVGAGELQHVMHRYLKPSLLLFQVVSQRYERGSIVLTTNRPFKKWAQIFNNDSTLTSALLDRLLHHAEVIVIEGPSFRGKDLVETDPSA
jgi:DNA replication protein DnaC